MARIKETELDAIEKKIRVTMDKISANEDCVEAHADALALATKLYYIVKEIRVIEHDNLHQKQENRKAALAAKKKERETARKEKEKELEKKKKARIAAMKEKETKKKQKTEKNIAKAEVKKEKLTKKAQKLKEKVEMYVEEGTEVDTNMLMNSVAVAPTNDLYNPEDPEHPFIF